MPVSAKLMRQRETACQLLNGLVILDNARILLDTYYRVVMLLTGQILELGDTRIEMLVRIIHNRRRLEFRLVVRFMLELERPIRQFAIAIIEEFIHRSGVDYIVIRHQALDLPIVSVQK